MKKLSVCIYCLFIFFLSLRVSAQDWQPIAPNITAHYVSDMEVYQGDLYLGGILYTLDNKPISGLARWDGSDWHPVGRGTNSISTFPGANTDVSSLVEYKGELYIAGGFDSVDHIAAANIARYNGASWNRVGNSLETNRSIYQIEVFQNELYACGLFERIGGVYAPGIAKWDGTNWSRVGNKYFTSVQAFIPYQNNIYVIAREVDSTSAPPIVTNGFFRWNGAVWDQIPRVPTNTPNFQWNFFGREVYNGKLLYASFWEYFQPGISRFSVVEWDGNSWSVFDSTLKEDVCAMTLHQNQIYVGYDGTKLAGPIIQKREENIWKDVGTLAGGKPRKFLEYNNQLYVCGEFLGGVVYRYDFPTPIDSDEPQSTVQIFPNPAKDILNFSYTLSSPQEVQLTVYDLTGKQIVHKDYGFKESGSGRETITVQNLAPGMYIVEVKVGDEIVTEKIVKL